PTAGWGGRGGGEVLCDDPGRLRWLVLGDRGWDLGEHRRLPGERPAKHSPRWGGPAPCAWREGPPPREALGCRPHRPRPSSRAMPRKHGISKGGRWVVEALGGGLRLRVGPPGKRSEERRVGR